MTLFMSAWMFRSARRRFVSSTRMVDAFEAGAARIRRASRRLSERTPLELRESAWRRGRWRSGFGVASESSGSPSSAHVIDWLPGAAKLRISAYAA
jgi:hypothetical protein